ncbi:MAG: hypothetical protein HFI44_06640 [Lachnospiraceae bacterium]|nr:hypothetical protein [Lachnospiraceae bacterium]GFI03180.1 hypothetical protein IMSAGC005_02012 [Lachnospiraceae bacterium]
MGIRINVSNNQDSSYLFQSLSSSGGMGNLNFLSDYASIKNGSYGKLMKSYYGVSQSSSTTASSKKYSSNNVLERILEEKKNPKVSKDVQKANGNLTMGLSSLKSSVSALQSDKTYTDTEKGQSAEDKVVSAVKSYVSDYNNVVNAAKGSTLSNKTAYVANMMRSSATNADKLSEIGVTINSDGTLELNEAKLKAAGTSKVQELFSPDNLMSYGSMIASRVQFAGTSTGTNATDNTQTNNTTGSAAVSLKEAGKALASDKLYEKVKDKDGNETNKYDVDKIFATAKSFVSNYNKMFDAAESSSNSGVLANLSYIREKTARSEDVLKQFGISVDRKGRMKIDEDTFKKADMSKVQQFFKDYGSSVATNASLVDYYMTTQANAASGYTATGEYSVQGSARYAGII